MRWQRSCLWLALPLGAAIAGPATSKPAPCPLTERSFLGQWTTPAGNEIVENDVRAIAFEYEDGKRTFSEWLHFRPMGNGTWRMENCGVTVTDHEITWRFRFLGNDGKRLVEVPYSKGSAIYRRVR